MKSPEIYFQSFKESFFLVFEKIRSFLSSRTKIEIIFGILNLVLLLASITAIIVALRSSRQKKQLGVAPITKNSDDNKEEEFFETEENNEILNKLEELKNYEYLITTLNINYDFSLKNLSNLYLQARQVTEKYKNFINEVNPDYIKFLKSKKINDGLIVQNLDGNDDDIAFNPNTLENLVPEKQEEKIEKTIKFFNALEAYRGFIGFFDYQALHNLENIQTINQKTITDFKNLQKIKELKSLQENEKTLPDDEEDKFYDVEEKTSGEILEEAFNEGKKIINNEKQIFEKIRFTFQKETDDLSKQLKVQKMINRNLEQQLNQLGVLQQENLDLQDQIKKNQHDKNLNSKAFLKIFITNIYNSKIQKDKAFLLSSLIKLDGVNFKKENQFYAFSKRLLNKIGSSFSFLKKSTNEAMGAANAVLDPANPKNKIFSGKTIRMIGSLVLAIIFYEKMIVSCFFMLSFFLIAMSDFKENTVDFLFENQELLKKIYELIDSYDAQNINSFDIIILYKSHNKKINQIDFNQDIFFNNDQVDKENKLEILTKIMNGKFEIQEIILKQNSKNINLSTIIGAIQNIGMP